uniref:DNA repair metallo-beta-lactamase domain-containing protein n=1 Tax=Leersia perrieri TaxID=77586 RepID=A0A0D9W4G8_9ORYZ
MGTDGDGEAISPMRIPDGLDDNGFPLSSSPSSSSAAADDDETSSFAADFYRSGADWSSLRAAAPPASEEVSGTKERSGGLLVQRSLFQAWGIEKKPARREEAGVGVRGEASSAPPGSWSGRKRRRGGEVEAMADRRKPLSCPFYKKIPGTPFTVDAFRYGAVEECRAYFLSHFHHDHYGGLTKKWCHGLIYCTALTARLVKMCLSVNPDYICPLELDKEYVIEGVLVTLLEANHCPGAALIHYRLGDGKTYLHTGDFRASKSMQLHPLLQRGRINLLYLDTTYCNPKYKCVYATLKNKKFPPKEDVIDFVVKTSQRYLQKEPRTLIVVGAYSIGKENVYLAISKALENLKKYMETLNQRFVAVLAFRPTGWTFSEPIGVPYSEHSSFTELRDFVMFLRPQKVIPTVNIGNAATRDKMRAHFQEWMKGS